MKIETYKPGTKVSVGVQEVERGNLKSTSKIDATVLRVIVHPEAHVQYVVAWWQEGSRRTATVERHEVSGTRATSTIDVGFKPEERETKANTLKDDTSTEEGTPYHSKEGTTT